MRRSIIKTLILVTTTFILACTAQAQEASVGRLRLDSLDKLAPKAEDAVNIELDGILIKFAGSILSDEDADERAVKELVSGLKGVYVRSYEFKSEGQFAEADVAAVRAQLRAPGWSRVMDVKSRGLDFGDAEVYLATAGGRVEGFALLAVGPREVTVVNIVGAIDLARLRQLGDDLNLPHIHIKRKKSDGN